MSGGAAELAEIFGTEKDKVNCAFYFKIGACRHGDRCTRLHHKPTFSQSLILKNMYQSPYAGTMQAEYDGEGNLLIDAAAQEDFDNFYEDIYCEIQRNYGPIEELNVSGNLGDHLIGNVYIKMRYEEDASRLVDAMNKRWYNGQPIYAELSPVTDFREACCRQFEVGECNRGGFCNFMHLKPISRVLQERLDRKFGRDRYLRSRRSPPRFSRAIHRDSYDRDRGYDYGRDYDRRGRR